MTDKKLETILCIVTMVVAGLAFLYLTSLLRAHYSLIEAAFFAIALPYIAIVFCRALGRFIELHE